MIVFYRYPLQFIFHLRCRNVSFFVRTVWWGWWIFAGAERCGARGLAHGEAGGEEEGGEGKGRGFGGGGLGLLLDPAARRATARKRNRPPAARRATAAGGRNVERSRKIDVPVWLCEIWSTRRSARCAFGTRTRRKSSTALRVVDFGARFWPP